MEVVRVKCLGFQVGLKARPMFKWEKRLETQWAGVNRVGWYYDGRGWGDLMEGTILQLPVPYRDYQIMLLQPYNYGGVGGDWGAPVGTYGY